MQTLRNKLVVITGAGSGIGRALALQCASAGAKLALCDVSDGGLAETQRAAEAQGAQVLTRKVDVSRRAELETFAQDVERAVGPADVLVNNAGVALQCTFEQMTLEDFEWIMSINFWGVVYGCRAFLAQLKARPEAHIVTVSSVFGLVGVPGQSAYSASKFAVRAFSESLRQELRATQVRITCVHPGAVRTNIARASRQYTNCEGLPADSEFEAQRFEKVAMTSADEAAVAIVRGILARRPRVVIGADARVFDVVQRLFPAHYERVTGAIVRWAQRRDR